MKVVINACFGGFGVSDEVIKFMEAKGHKTGYNMNRADPLLIEAVETLGEKANGPFAELRVIEIPDNIEWDIEDYDGNEWVAEKHRKWS